MAWLVADAVLMPTESVPGVTCESTGDDKTRIRARDPELLKWYALKVWAPYVQVEAHNGWAGQLKDWTPDVFRAHSDRWVDSFDVIIEVASNAQNSDPNTPYQTEHRITLEKLIQTVRDVVVGSECLCEGQFVNIGVKYTGGHPL